MLSVTQKTLSTLFLYMSAVAVACLGLASHALADKPSQEPVGSWVSLSGTVVDHTDDRFALDYGEGTITVEVDDWQEHPEGELLLNGDDVTVYGRVDSNFYQTRTIEADSIYVEDLNTVLTDPVAYDNASPAPEVYNYYTGPVDYDFEITGTVTSKDGREFTIDTGLQEVTVDTIGMGYNPMDDKGYQQIDKGDFVRVSGELDLNLFQEKEIIAESILTLS